MTPWTLTVTTHDRTRTIMGTADTTQKARREMFIATGSLMERGGDERPRYELSVGEQLVAIIQTGETARGFPDHVGAARMLDQIAGVDDQVFAMHHGLGN
ncbi:hypothetical protein BTO20_37580 (plasmid) [Mycobacterium dioxanotrophicus]|jgi:hypothetical protein|uniref:Uncharacterized protein n=2 Tax=Mycobacterium dioxanotrophicus TaxID=482462 RepID=A0A1Y0CH53_9MYCO|nr:hypothetical protein BTO20_37580 [Mycobacterium dioxanotrophicus]